LGASKLMVGHPPVLMEFSPDLVASKVLSVYEIAKAKNLIDIVEIFV